MNSLFVPLDFEPVLTKNKDVFSLNYSKMYPVHAPDPAAYIDIHIIPDPTLH